MAWEWADFQIKKKIHICQQLFKQFQPIRYLIDNSSVCFVTKDWHWICQQLFFPCPFFVFQCCRNVIVQNLTCTGQTSPIALKSLKGREYGKKITFLSLQKHSIRESKVQHAGVPKCIKNWCKPDLENRGNNTAAKPNWTIITWTT